MYNYNKLCVFIIRSNKISLKCCYLFVMVVIAFLAMYQCIWGCNLTQKYILTSQDVCWKRFYFYIGHRYYSLMFILINLALDFFYYLKSFYWRTLCHNMMKIVDLFIFEQVFNTLHTHIFITTSSILISCNDYELDMFAQHMASA